MYKLPTRRTPYVDIAKGIAILSVVLLHVDFVYPNLSFINISSMLGWYWHVPVFFLIGGFFLKEEKLLHPIYFIKGKFKSLYFFFLLIMERLHNICNFLRLWQIRSFKGIHLKFLFMLRHKLVIFFRFSEVDK